MDTFVPRMKTKYKDRLINREKQWPPCHSNKLVKLQIVKREKGEGYCANIQRGREEKAVKRTPLAYSDLFKVEKGKKPVRKVLVEGDAGIGKTTLSIALSEDWACEKLFQEFELLLLLPLRHEKVASAGSLPELLKLLHPSSDACKALASYMEEKEAEKVLIVADGWDELSKSDQQKGSFLYELLFESFPLMSVIVTSRPSASAPLHRLPCIDRFVEISGFSKEDIKEYIESEFTRDQEKASRLLEQLEDNPLVESVCSIPLNCSIMCHLWRTLEESLPSTMTQLYTKIVLNVILRNIQKKDAFKNVLSLPNFNALPKDLQQSFKLLCEFAFQSLEKYQIVFSQEELVDFFPKGLDSVEKILCFGLLQSAETVLETGHGVSFHFIHLTFMEYLAALYLVEQPQHGGLSELSQKDNDPYAKSRFTMVWRFFFGFKFSQSNIKVVTEGVTQAIKCVAYTSSYGEKTMSLCHCAFESQNHLIPDTMIALDLIKIRFVAPHTTYDCVAILYVIDQMMECSSIDIDFSYCGVGEKHVRMLTDVLASKQGNIQVRGLTLSGNKLTSKSLYDLFLRASVAFTKNNISSSLHYGLRFLDLSDNPLVACDLNTLEDVVRQKLLSTLHSLSLNGSLTCDDITNAEWLTTYMDALSTYCPELASLDLSQNNLGVAGASALARGLSTQQNVLTRNDTFALYLSKANINDVILKSFVDNIKGVCSFNTLFLSSNNIHAAGISYLSDAVCSGKIVIQCCNQDRNNYLCCNHYSNLDLSDNPLGLEGVISVGLLLSSNNCQPSEVNLSRCELTGQHEVIDSLDVSDNMFSESVLDVGQQLCRMPQNHFITRLCLDDNSFTKQNIHILVGFSIFVKVWQTFPALTVESPLMISYCYMKSLVNY